MRVSVVLLWLCLVGVQLLKGDDQLTVGDVQSRLDRLQKESHEETLELNSIEPCADVWAELRDLRDMVVEQRVQLQFSQSLIDELKKENADMNNRLLTSENQVKELKEQNSALQGRVASAEVGMEALRVESANNSKVAFSFASGILGYLGPLSADIILVFNKEITNIGNAFNPITGVFTAPVRGVYYFRFNLYGHNVSYWIRGYLFKNQERILYVTENPQGTDESAESAVTLLLETGDNVYVQLLAQSELFDNSSNRMTFSGFLVFPI